MGGSQRRSGHARRTISAPWQAGRTAATFQRAQGTDESRRSTTRASGVRVDVDRTGSVLRGPAQRQARDHGLGAGAILLRCDDGAIGEKARIRSLLRQEPHHHSRPPDPARDCAGRPPWRGRPLTRWAAPVISVSGARIRVGIRPAYRPDLGNCAALGPVYFFPSVVTGTARWVVLLEALTSLSPLFTRASLLPAPVKQFYVVAFALMRVRAVWQRQQRLFTDGELAAQELAYLRTSVL